MYDKFITLRSREAAVSVLQTGAVGGFNFPYKKIYIYNDETVRREGRPRLLIHSPAKRNDRLFF